ncbi:MAG: DPP IV N-terminal domain-containing protein, partial [Pseudomonadota bacterium]
MATTAAAQDAVETPDAPDAPEAPRLFSAEDVFELEWADDPQVSPDGTQAVYIRRFNDVMSDRTRSHVWIVNLDGSAHEPLLADENSYRSPRWSPDGTRIAYMRSVDGRTGLYVHYLGSGRSALIGTFEESPSGLTWSPDSQSLSFSMAVAGKSKRLVKTQAKPKGAKWAEPPVVIDRARYRSNASGFLDLAYNHVFVIPAEGGTERQLTKGDFNHGGALSFTPDGEEILFSANRNPDWELQSRESDIFSVNVTTGALTQLTDQPGTESSPKVSPDGKRIAYLGTGNQR